MELALDDLIKQGEACPYYRLLSMKIEEVREKAILMVLSTTPSEVGMEWRRTRDRYLALRIPVYPTLERAAKALANFVNYYERLHKSENALYSARSGSDGLI